MFYPGPPSRAPAAPQARGEQRGRQQGFGAGAARGSPIPRASRSDWLWLRHRGVFQPSRGFSSHPRLSSSFLLELEVGFASPPRSPLRQARGITAVVPSPRARHPCVSWRAAMGPGEIQEPSVPGLDAAAAPSSAPERASLRCWQHRRLPLRPAAAPGAPRVLHRATTAATSAPSPGARVALLGFRRLLGRLRSPFEGHVPALASPGPRHRCGRERRARGALRQGGGPAPSVSFSVGKETNPAPNSRKKTLTLGILHQSGEGTEGFAFFGNPSSGGAARAGQLAPVICNIL